MLPPITTDTVSVELQSGSTVECTNEVLEELRRLAVAGLTAFGRGGLEIGGVLYGLREGPRLLIRSFAEFTSEHARGPGFLLSEKDRQGFGHLVNTPAGLETLGWYRTHTRSDLRLDAGDRELFDQFPTPATAIGLLLKPAHWGPSAAAFYVREQSGAIAPEAPREFAIEPPARRPREQGHTAEAGPAVNQAAGLPQAMPRVEAPAVIEAPARAEPPARLRTQLVPQMFSRSEKRWAMAVAAAAVLVIAVILTLLIRAHHPRALSLQAVAVAPGQLRISWNRDSQPVIGGISGMVEIRDGDGDTRIPLSADQLRLNGITYTQKTEHVAIEICASMDGDLTRHRRRSRLNLWDPCRRPSPRPARRHRATVRRHWIRIAGWRSARRARKHR